MKFCLRFKMLPLLVVSMAIVLLNNCDKSPTTSEPENFGSDEAAIRTLIESDKETFHTNGLDDEGAQDAEYDLTNLSKTSDQINTVRFGRKGQFRFESITIDFSGPPNGPDTLAVATIIRSFDGNFHVVEKDTSESTPEEYKIYVKEMENAIVRKAKFRRVNNTDNPLQNWRLFEVSCSEGVSDPTTIQIETVSIEASNMEPITVTEPTEYFMNREEGVPVFAPGDTVKIFATLNNTNSYPPEPGTTMLLHFGVDHQMRRARKPFNDEGIYPDQVPGDGVFSGYWIANYRLGVYHAVFDAIDNGTIFDDTAPYNSTAWGIIYKVQQ